MAAQGFRDLEDPLKRVMPRTGPPVQNLGGFAPNTAPLSLRPIASPGVKGGTPGPAPLGSGQIAQVPPQANAMIPKPPPAAPAGAPASAPAGGGAAPAGPDLYGRSGGASAPAGSLEDQIRGYITNALGGVTSKGFIDRAKNQLGSAIEGQRAQAVGRINEDAIRRGLFRSGIPAEQIAATETGARSALSQGIADILSRAEQQDIAGRESAVGVAGNLLSSNRAWDQYAQQRADEQAARAAANAPRDTTFQYMDPDTGEVYTLDEQWFS